MKKVLRVLPAVFLLALFGFSQISYAEGEDVETLSQELEKNKELLEIWKGHVKTLTKERDTAYREIEELKSQGFVV